MLLKRVKCVTFVNVLVHYGEVIVNHSNGIWTIYEVEIRLDGINQTGNKVYWQPIYHCGYKPNYTTKWVETKPLWDNTTQSTTKKLYEHIIIRFGCPTHLVSDQGNYFINRILKYSHKDLWSPIANQILTIPKKMDKLSQLMKPWARHLLK